MGAVKNKSSKKSRAKHAALEKEFADPLKVLSIMSDFVREGDLPSCLDVIGSYISLSPKYKSKQDFAEKIDTSRMTLYRMFAHDETVSMKVLFAAVEQIRKDAE